MIYLNEGIKELIFDFQIRLLDKFQFEQLTGVEMGVAYGGGVEALARVWKDRGIVYGYDTFVGHPIYITPDQTNLEATCMRYVERQQGKEKMNIDYIRRELEDQGLDNVRLIQGLVTPQSCADLEKIHYAMLDMDMLESMGAGYEAVKDKIVPGGYLLLHDIDVFPRLNAWYSQIIKPDPRWTVINEEKLVILERAGATAAEPKNAETKKPKGERKFKL